MPKVGSQKQKLLQVREILLKETDERHSLSMPEIVKLLNRDGTPAERKSIRDDIDALYDFGLDIAIDEAVRPTQYRVLSRDFQLAELKILIDSIQASKFITKTKSEELIDKIAHLSSKHEAAVLERPSVIVERIKNMNESIYYNVDYVQQAIYEDHRISFRYFNYDVKKEKAYHRDGAIYEENPFALIYADDNYYLLTYSDDEEKFKHYRIDRMEKVSVLSKPRSKQSKEKYSLLNLSVYTKRAFSMYGGIERRVCMRFANKLSGVVIDRFGKDVRINIIDDDWFEINEYVMVSSMFFGWILSFGSDAYIVGSDSIKKKMQEYLREIVKNYDISNN